MTAGAEAFAPLNSHRAPRYELYAARRRSAMIEFRCPQCGQGLQAAEEYAGGKAKCFSCGGEVQIPEPVRAKGIRVQEGGLGTPIGVGPAETAPERPSGVAKRFPLAEASCRIWRAGEMPPPGNPEHRVADVSRTGLRVVLGKRAKRRTLVHVQQAPWKQGDEVELDLRVGAFANPIRLYAEVVRVEARGLGKGAELALRITRANEDALKRLELLEQRDDLRQRRKSDEFRH